MSRNYSLYLQDILVAIDRIDSYLEGVTREAFETEQMRLDAVIRNLQIIGEAINRIPHSIREEYPQVPWQEIVAFRNRVTHVYFNLDIDIVWNVVRRELPTLKTQIQAILKSTPDDTVLFV